MTRLCMSFFSFWSDYLVWHYSQALVGYIRIFRNLWWFLVQKFSLPELLRSLLLPYKRITEAPTGGFDLEAWAGIIIINILSRLLGFIIRSVIIVAGIIVLTIFTMVGFISYALWLGAPLVVASAVIGGGYLLGWK